MLSLHYLTGSTWHSCSAAVARTEWQPLQRLMLQSCWQGFPVHLPSSLQCLLQLPIWRRMPDRMTLDTVTTAGNENCCECTLQLHCQQQPCTIADCSRLVEPDPACPCRSSKQQGFGQQ